MSLLKGDAGLQHQTFATSSHKMHQYVELEDIIKSFLTSATIQ